MQKKENIYNIPNLLSLYRLLAVPVLAYVVYLEKENLFFYWFLFNMFTDALDGFIARKFNMQTKLGAKLDSTADFAMYLLVMYAFMQLKWKYLEPYKISFYIIFFYYLFIDIFALIKFKEIASLHLYISKVNGIIQGFFFLLLFTVGYNEVYYWLMFVLATYGFIENMYFLIKLNKMQTGLKGIYWYKKNI
jgi:CDP-diacylglycerol--glycerol-3-phosphate 3-phosphatidyltransferase